MDARYDVTVCKGNNCAVVIDLSCTRPFSLFSFVYNNDLLTFQFFCFAFKLISPSFNVEQPFRYTKVVGR